MCIETMSKEDIEDRLEELEIQEWRINVSTDFFTQSDWDYLHKIRNERLDLLEELKKR